MFDRSVLERTDPTAQPKQIVTSAVPDLRFTTHLEYVIRQAQSRLKGRSPEELRIGAGYLEQLFKKADQIAFDRAFYKRGAEPPLERINDPIAFSLLFQEQELDKKEDFPDASAITYFSLLALIYALECLEYLKRYEDAKEREQAAMHSLVLERAKEMIAFIQGMEFQGIFRKKLATQANQARYQPFNELKQQIFDFVDSECGEYSNRKSSQIAYLQFKEAIDAAMDSDDPEHQIAKWIGQHRREQKAGDE